MEHLSRHFTILIAEDDEDDYLLTLEALKAAGVDNKIHWFKDGEELMAFLNQWVKDDPVINDPPGLILLDLNMPRKDGREALEEIKSHPTLRKIPVVVMSTSKAESDITRAYELGVNSFIQKPVRFDEFVKVIKVMCCYWLETVKLPV